MFTLNDVLAFSRGLYSLYRSLHWNAISYEDHLVFEKLYTMMEDEMDNVGTIGPINETEQIKKILYFCISDPIVSEQRFLQMIDSFLDTCPSTGTDSMLADIYSAHEKNLYLLRMII
jgi:DNA-binding ferritin-like protein